MKANEIIEAIRNGNAALYRSKKDRTIGIISEGVHNKQSVKDQRGCLAGRYQPCLLVLSGPRGCC